MCSVRSISLTSESSVRASRRISTLSATAQRSHPGRPSRPTSAWFGDGDVEPLVILIEPVEDYCRESRGTGRER